MFMKMTENFAEEKNEFEKQGNSRRGKSGKSNKVVKNELMMD